MNSEEQSLDTILSQNVFVDTFSEKLTDETGSVERQRVATEIYNVLFGLNLSDFSKNQFLLLSTLLHSEDALQSAEIFKEIVLLFPHIWNYIESIYKHKMLLPNIYKNSENTKSQQTIFSSAFESPSQKNIQIYKNIQATLFDVFSGAEDYNHF